MSVQMCDPVGDVQRRAAVSSNRHFQVIADVLCELQEAPARLNIIQHGQVVNLFANALADTNDYFDKDRFVDACHR